MQEPRQQPKDHLVTISSALLRVSREALIERQVAVSAMSGLILIAVPTPEAASTDERRVHSANVRLRLRELLGSATREAVSHTRGVTVVVGSCGSALNLGVDIERVRPERPRIAHRILTERELLALGGEPVPWLDVLRVFCIKEAAYKSVSPQAQAGLGFRSLGHEWVGDVANVRMIKTDQICARASTAVGGELLVAVAERTGRLDG
jgi:phosphopantetheinyl transferase (holo-ACP synthase)